MKPDSSQLLHYLRAVRQRWPLVVLVVVVTTSIALGISLSSEKQYDASAELLLRGQEPVNTLLDGGAGGASNDPERDLNTEVFLIKAAANAEAVRKQLGLSVSADELLASVTTATSNTSNIVTLTVRDRDPKLAARIANAFASTYVAFRLNSARQRYLQAAEQAQRQLSSLSSVELRTVQGRELQARKRELEIAAALQTGGAEVVRQAAVPSAASRPRPKLNAALGIFLGIIFGVGAALLLNLVDRRFSDEQEVEAFFKLPILASIPRPARRGIQLNDPAQREAYGMLAANLALSGGGRPSSVVMVTSPGPSEGKTSVTLGVARAYAQLGLNVIAIEADLRRPTFGRYADLSGSAGLTGVLAGRVLARELVWLDAATLRPVSDDSRAGSIGLLPAGELPENPQRTLSDSAMNLVADVARSLADVVIVDTPPVGTVNDATVLARVVEGVVVVVRVNTSTKDAARRASRTLGNLEADLLGLVITDAGEGERHGYYYSKTGGAPAPTEPVRSGVEGGRD